MGAETKSWEAKGAYVFEGSDCIAVCDTDNADAASYAKRATLMAAAPDLLAWKNDALIFMRAILPDLDCLATEEARTNKALTGVPKQTSRQDRAAWCRAVLSKAEGAQ